jgi:formate dehydrogenase iron-sulfur subunit
MPKAITIDLMRCTFCRACEVACEREHGGIANMFVQLVDERYAVPINCRHCRDGACVQVCPTHALHRETDDAVTIAPIKCIGCGLCTIACPIGAVRLDALTKTARKCDLCLPRLQQNLLPACVATCSARALSFREIEHPVFPIDSWDPRKILDSLDGGVLQNAQPSRHEVVVTHK